MNQPKSRQTIPAKAITLPGTVADFQWCRTLLLALLLIGLAETCNAQQKTGHNEPATSRTVVDSGTDAKDTNRLKKLNAARPFDFEKFGGIVYRVGKDFQLKLDVYQPKGDGPFPGLLTVHGGSWRSGSKVNWTRHARKMVKAGYVVVAINYRHAPHFKFPAQIHDCKAAVRWMRTNAARYKIDPEQIGGLGYSAGGHLVALMGTSDSDDGLEGDVPEDQKEISTRLQAVAAGGAPCEFSWIQDDANTLAYWLGGSPNSNPDTFRMASPTSFISKDDPPFHFFHGTDDWIVPKASSRIMHDALQKQGVHSSYKAYSGYGHFALFSHVEAMNPVIEFFDRSLKRKYP